MGLIEWIVDYWIVILLIILGIVVIALVMSSPTEISTYYGISK
jgi:hypothetical protein